jgi:hypothetical protein
MSGCVPAACVAGGINKILPEMIDLHIMFFAMKCNVEFNVIVVANLFFQSSRYREINPTLGAQGVKKKRKDGRAQIQFLI